MIKRFLSIFIAIAVMLPTIVIPVSADTTPDWTGFQISNGTATVEDGVVTLTAENGNLVYSKQYTNSVSFDASVTFKVLKYGGGTADAEGSDGISIQHRNNWQRVYMSLQKNYFVYHSDDNTEKLGVSYATHTGNALTDNNLHTIRTRVYYGDVTVWYDGVEIMNFAAHTGGGKAGFYINLSKYGSVELHDYSYTSIADPAKEELVAAPTESFRDDFDGDLSAWRVTEFGTTSTIADSKLHTGGDGVFKAEYTHAVGESDIYSIEFKSHLIDTDGNDGTYMDCGFQYRMTDGRVWLSVYPGFIAYYDDTGWKSYNTERNVNVDVTWRIDYDNGMVTIFRNDVQVLDAFAVSKSGGSEIPYLEIFGSKYAGGQSNWWDVDYISYTPVVRNIVINDLLDNSQFLTEEPIAFSATPQIENVPYVEFYANGVRIGEAKAEDDYAFTWEGAIPGKYEIQARYGEHNSKPIKIEVVESAKAVPTVTAGVTEGQAVSVSADLYYTDNITHVGTVVDGEIIDASLKEISSITDSKYTYSISGLSADVHSVAVIMQKNDGTSIMSDASYVEVLASGSSATTKSAVFNAEYTTSGSGSVVIANGTYKYSATHNGSTIVFETADGSKTVNANDGAYRAQIDDGVVELYRNNSMLTSFVMPRSSSVSTTTSGVSGFKLTPDTKRRILYSRTLGAGESINERLWNECQSYTVEYKLADGETGSLNIADGGYNIKIDFKADAFYGVSRIMGGAQVEAVREYTEKIAARPSGDVSLRIEVVKGIVTIYANGKTLGALRTPEHNQTANIKANFSKGGTMVIRALSKEYTFYDDFNRDNRADSLDYWDVENLTTITDYDNSKITVAATSSGTMLFSAFAQNPSVKANVKLNSNSDSFWIIFRYGVKGYSYRIGYDGSSKSFTLDSVGTSTTNLKKASALTAHPAFYLQPTKAYDYELVTNGYNVSLIVGDKTVLSGTVSEINHGRVGFELKNATAVIDNFSYAGNGVVTPTFKESKIDGLNDGLGFLEKDGEVYAYTSANGMAEYKYDESTDSWIKNSTNAAYHYDIVKMASGNLLSYYDASDTFYHSTDNGATWVEYGKLEDPDGHDIFANTAGSLYLSPVTNRLFYTTVLKDLMAWNQGREDDGSAGVYYSDDEGKTWTRSKTIFTTHEVEGVESTVTHLAIQEPKIVDTGDGSTVLLWARNAEGHAHYYISNDGGVTFDGTPVRAPLPTTQTTFSITRDKYEENTFWSLWEYDTVTDIPSNRWFPRSRIALAVSKDGCKTWQFVADVNSYDIKSNMNAASVGKLTHMNHYIYAAEDAIYMGWLSQEPYAGTTGTCGRVIRIERDSIVPLPHFVPVRLNSEREPDALFTEVTQNSIIVKKATNEFNVRGAYAIDENCPEGYIPAQFGATLVSGKLSQTTVTNSAGSSARRINITVGTTSFKMTEGENQFLMDAGSYATEKSLKFVGDKAYIPAEVLAQAFDKNLTETEDGYLLITDYEGLRDDQKAALDWLF